MTTALIFHPVIKEYWDAQFSGTIIYKRDNFRITLREDLEHDERMMTLEFQDGGNHIVVDNDVWTEINNGWLDHIDFDDIIQLLNTRGIKLHGADCLFYFSEDSELALKEWKVVPEVRALREEDATLFTKFESAATTQDLEGASVSLQHWMVFGAFEGDKLVAVASMYPWDDDFKIADLGVLTLTEFRGKGYAHRVVNALCKAALLAGYHPQYRCQLENYSSTALAKRLGMNLFAKWNIISQGE
ncbi:GNAT family N-acetyltransferase [Sphingobacterium yanglingense]|uniref:GNAT acetyltransferase-like protein n=1 Tax=Sphingobacterium yanglingense TaxID=1437280 RepID=A0A4R6WJH1_9SPHI|nr:GNAT family N-acetyltransferase [Sphingobacterium yanglingense]TDQ77880.1 GNAT acetyltransferase-like protein [Sphingobacterium yanglingense]